MYDILDKIDTTPETELERIFMHIMHKVEAFANILKLDPNSRDFLRRVLRNAFMLYVLVEERQGSLREYSSIEDCVSSLSRIPSANLNKVEHSFYLARDIAEEYLLETSIKNR